MSELVPRPRPVPALPPPRPVRAWLRELLTVPHPGSYLALGEQVLVTTRRHWLVPVREIARGVGMMTALTAAAVLTPGGLLVHLALLAAAVAHSAYMGWCIIDWRLEQIAATDSRLIRVSGILATRVDTVPLAKVTDLSLHRSVPGRVLGYGELRVETAGQRPCIDRLTYLPAPGEVYRAMLR